MSQKPELETFSRWVEEALGHLHDHWYLQTHPLAAVLLRETATSVRGRTLHHRLIAAIDELKPPPSAPPSSPAWRKYRYLWRRYVEAVTAEHVSQELGITDRQGRRDHRQALDALTSLLWSRCQPAEAQPGASAEPELAPPASDSPGLSLVDELSRLGQASPGGVSDLGETAQGALATVASLGAQRGVQVELALGPTPPLAMNRTVLRQVLIGLLTFTVERAAAGHVVVESSAEAVQVELCLAFTPYRLEQGRRPSGVGTPADAGSDESLVMAARRLVEMQGGTLEHRPEGEQIEVIRLALPIAHQVSLLVVDDNPGVAQLFRRYLGARYEVRQAAMADEALELALDAAPDIIVLDVMLPGVDGWELLERLQTTPQTSGIPVVVCSVLREGTLALSLGATAFLAKPVTQRTLRAALEQCSALSPRPPTAVAGRRGSPAGSG